MQEDQELQRQRIDYVSDWMWEADTNGILTFSNAVVRSTLGYEPENIVGKAIFNLVAPSHVEKCQEIFRVAKETMSPVKNVVAPFPTTSGELKSLETSCVLLFDADDNLVGFRGITRDVSERLRSEAALLEAEAKYRSLVEGTLVGVFILQGERIVYANPCLAEMLGYTQQELQESPKGSLIVAPESRNQVRANLATLYKGDATHSRSHDKMLRKDGHVIDVDSYGALTTYQGGPAIIGTLVDRTEQNQAISQLHYRAELEKVITSLATEFINLPPCEIDSGIDKALKVTSEFIGADRSFVFLVHDEGTKISNTHEWCAPGVESVISQFQDMPADQLPLLAKGLAGRDAIYIPSIADLGPEHLAENEIFKNEKVKSFVALPMLLHGKAMGFLGFESVIEKREWSEDSIMLLKILGEILMNALDGKMAANAILDKQARLDSIFRAAPIGIGMVMHRVLAEVNDRLCEMIGYSKAELVGQSSRMLYPTQDEYERVGREKYEQIALRGIGTVETRMQRKDGSIFDVLLSSAPIAPDDLSQGVTFTMLDVTERKEAEEDLRESERRYRLLFEKSPDSVFVLRDGRFIEANAAALNTFGYSREELIGQYPWNLSPEYQPGQVLSKVLAQRHIEDALCNRPQLFDWVHKRRNGDLIDCNVSLAAYTIGDDTFVLAIVRDVTEHKRAEEQRRAMEKQFEEQQRTFYRETILSVTDGKLEICDVSRLKPYLTSAQFETHVTEASQVSESRARVTQLCRDAGLEGERLESYIIGVGEAITNAIKHASSGHVYAGVKDDSVWMAVRDKGSGISSLILPRATLQRGYSTKPSMGLGYSIMIEVSDQVLLNTGKKGTTVILVEKIKEPVHSIDASGLPDTWASIPD